MTSGCVTGRSRREWCARVGAGAALVVAALLGGAANGGACCYPDGSCVQESEIVCDTFHGTYQGDGTTCAAAGCLCTADLDASGDVAFSDLLNVLASWGPCPGCPADLDGDGTVRTSDLMLVFSSWGPC